MSYDILMDEPLRIGIIASQDDVESFKRLFPEVICYHYENLEELLLLGEIDEVDIAVIDVAYLGQKETQRVRGGFVSQGQYGTLESLSERFPTILLIGSESIAPKWKVKGVTMLRKPVDDLLLVKHLTDYEESIRLKRLRRLFQKVAAAFAANSEDNGGREYEL